MTIQVKCSSGPEELSDTVTQPCWASHVLVLTICYMGCDVVPYHCDLSHHSMFTAVLSSFS